MPENSHVQSHRDLKVWQLGMQIAEDVYALSRTFPSDERFCLTSQLRRAAVSVPANIAEGNGRGTTREYLRSLSIAVGSLAEVETYLDLAERLAFAEQTEATRIRETLTEERRMLRGLQRSLRAKLDPGP